MSLIVVAYDISKPDDVPLTRRVGVDYHSLPPKQEPVGCESIHLILRQ